MFVEITDKRGLVVPINTTHIGYYYTKADPKPTCVLQMQGGKVMNAEFDSSDELQSFIDLINSSGSGGGGGGAPSIKDGGVIQKPTQAEFPAVGDVKNLYIDQETATPYYWSSKENKYKPFAGGTGGDAVLEKTIVSNEKCGAANSGTTFPQGMSFTQFAEKVLRTDKGPNLTLTSTNSGVKECGAEINGTTMTLKITNMNDVTHPMTDIKFYFNNTQVGTTQAFKSGTNTYSQVYSSKFTLAKPGSITTRGTVTHNGSSTAKAENTFQFVNASYYGICKLPGEKEPAKSDVETFAADVVSQWTTGVLGTKTLADGSATKVTTTNRNLNYSFDLADERDFYMYPQSYGLATIKDGLGYDMKDSFTRFDIKIQTPNGESADYYFYILTQPVGNKGLRRIYS